MEERRHVKTMTEEEEREFIRDFPATPNKVLAKRYGVSRTIISQRAKRLGVEKDAEWLRRTRVEYMRKARSSWTDESRRKMSEAKRRAFKAERSRIVMGLPQKTRLRISFAPPSKKFYVKRMRHLGYISVNDNAHRGILYYDGNTKRGRIAETHAARHYIKILPLPEDIKQIV